MNAGQFDQLMAQLHRMREGQDLGLGAIRDAQRTGAILAALREIRDRLPVQSAPTAEVPDVAPGAATVDLRGAWMREAFQAVLETLDAWIEGAWENHAALRAHKGEVYPCWEQFHPQDIRSMVADAARQLKVELPEPPTPAREHTVGQ